MNQYFALINWRGRNLAYTGIIASHSSLELSHGTPWRRKIASRVQRVKSL